MSKLEAMHCYVEALLRVATEAYKKNMGREEAQRIIHTFAVMRPSGEDTTDDELSDMDDTSIASEDEEEQNYLRNIQERTTVMNRRPASVASTQTMVTAPATPRQAPTTLRPPSSMSMTRRGLQINRDLLPNSFNEHEENQLIDGNPWAQHPAIKERNLRTPTSASSLRLPSPSARPSFVASSNSSSVTATPQNHRLVYTPTSRCASGRIDMYNVQSGIHRKTFDGPDGHKKAITGLTTDNINRYLITASVDKTIKIWDIKTAKVIHTIDLESPVVAIRYHMDNDLLAVACDDLGIRVVDLETHKVIREFWGHRNRITDFVFSPDSRWIVSASLDGTVRTWDLPTGSMIDIFRVEDIVTCLAFSPEGDFLATAHVDNNGIFLWANRTQYSNISLRHITDDDEAQLLDLPSMQGDQDESDVEGDEEVDIKREESLDTVEQLAEQMITMSMEPRAKWQNLLHLDTIKLRNKPKEAPKLPEKAPFFLPTLPGAKAQFNLEPMDVDKDKQDEQTKTKQLSLNQLNTETEYSKLLRSGHESSNYDAFVNYAKTLSPAAIDVELRSFTIDGELTVLNYFLEAIVYMLKSRKNFELAQAWLSVFLAIHGDLIITSTRIDIHEKIKTILSIQNTEFGRLSEQIHYSLCLIDFARRT
ncbi:hypothetical protein RMATCC62417_15426 [Rhizopus microsporus]|nr:hypothetical protein RMATCC62417_15426 [Rhizopus microsporus]